MRTHDPDGYPQVSILTPTWNRATYLDRVWLGLNSQTYRDFEWIVADDGSSDETASVVKRLASVSNFKISLIQASVHVGKARMDNEAIARAEGEFILWNDSDDYLLPNALETLLSSWCSIPEHDREDYVGVTALCADERGVISTQLPYQGVFSTTWNDLAEKHKVRGDMLNLTRARAIKECPFPEVDFVIPEGVTWTTLGNRRIIICPQVLQIKKYGESHGISFSGKMEYNYGRAYAMAVSEYNLRAYPRSLKIRLWKLITYIRLSVHGEICLRDAVGRWGGNSSLFSFLLMLPVGHLFALKDRLQGKVRKTHRDFVSASKLVTITYTCMGGGLDGESSNS